MRQIFTGVQKCERCGHEESWQIKMVPDPYRAIVRRVQVGDVETRFMCIDALASDAREAGDELLVKRICALSRDLIRKYEAQ